MSYTNDSTNARTKLFGYLYPPPVGGPTITTAQLWRRTSPAGTWAQLLAQTIGAPLVSPTLTWKPRPSSGNLIVNGSLATTYDWTLHATDAFVTDALSPSGYAVRKYPTASAQDTYQDLPVSPSTAYSFAASVKTDGVAGGRIQVQFLQADRTTATGAAQNGNTVTATSYTESVLTNNVSPVDAAWARVRLDPTAAGVVFIGAVRAFQQTGAAAAWAASHQQLSGNLGLSITTATTLQLPLPTGFSLADFSVAGVLRPVAAQTDATARTWLYLYVDANNYVKLQKTAGNAITLTKVRAGISSSISDAGALGYAASDVVAFAIKVDAVGGLQLVVSKNGGAASSFATATVEAVQMLTTTPVIYVGSEATANNANATFGILRFQAAATTLATLQALLASAATPYGDVVDADAAVWLFEQQIYQVPVYNDRLIALGTAYDYRWDTIGGSPAVTTTGAVFTTTTVAALDSWWLRSSTDATKDLKIPVINTFKHQVPRGTVLYSPVDGGKDLAVLAAAPGGYQAKLDLMFTALSDQVAAETKLKTLQAATEDLYLQTQFGDLLKIVLKDAVGFDQHETINDVSLDVAEVL